MKKPWENNSGCKDFAAYRALQAVEEEEQRVSDFIKAIKILARLCGMEITNWVQITVKKTGRTY
jgi:hypothetical protein